MKSFVAFTCILFAGLFCQAQESLIMNSCVVVSSQGKMLAFSEGESSHFGMSCKTVTSLQQTATVVQMAVMPAMIAINTPAVKAALASDLATVGAVVGSPAVLAVTAVGALGITTIYFVLKQSVEECQAEEQEAFRQRILREVDAKLGTQSRSSTPLTIRP